MLGAELTNHLLTSTILTAVVALLVLWLYRRAVLQGMRRGDDRALPLPEPVLREDLHAPITVAQSHRWERRVQRRVALAYLLTTLLCAAPLALAYRYFADPASTPAEYVAFTLIFAMACAPMIAAALALPARRAFVGVVLLIVFFMTVALIVALLQRTILGRSIGTAQLQLIPIFLKMGANELWQPALFWLLTWPKRLRGIAPITFAALLVFGLAPVLGLHLTRALAATEFGTPIVLRLGLNSMFVLIALPVGWVAWQRLHRVARGYDVKRFSDTQLLARTWWIMLVALVGVNVMTVAERWWPVVTVCVLVALAFGPVHHWLLTLTRSQDERYPPRTLLLLRVFGYTARTERLFDRIGARWRLFGPVTMIAAPDVAARTIDAGDYLRWLTGRMDELFVTAREDLNTKLAALDLAPDPDGRYRVNEFCCRDNTWQATVVELMQRADVVIMDLRGITAGRRGCEFELQQLALRLPPERLVLVTDATTDRSVLDTAFGERVSAVRIIDVRRSRDTDRVFDALLAAA